ncbi:hypothetical protein AHF37_05834 [Paragonimus kellicotti]|nr:hypothetical protein AHF37_05834 [Paragonimus kellicotti]
MEPISFIGVQSSRGGDGFNLPRVEPMSPEAPTFSFASSWHALVVDGHNVNELLSAFSTARSIKDKPVALLCKTFKGADLPGIADQENWHGKPLGSKSAEVIRYLEAKLKVGASGDIGSTLGRLKPSPPLDDCTPMKLIGSISLPSPPQYKLGEQVSFCTYVVSVVDGHKLICSVFCSVLSMGLTLTYW